MNALPVKTPTPQQIIDDLIAEFGIKKVVFATIARLFKRTRPPDSTSFRGLSEQADVDGLSNHLRADIGLPPDDGRRLHIDPITLGRHRM